MNVWADYRRCAGLSRSLKSKLNKWRLLSVLLLAGGGILGLLAQQHGVRWLAAASAVALALAAYVSKEALSAELEHNWILARSIAEALKTESYKFITTVTPYHDDEANRHLLDKSKQILGDFHLGSAAYIEDSEKVRNLPGSWLSMDDYLAERVDEQLRYYDKSAAENHTAHCRLRNLVVVLSGVGVVLGALSTTVEGVGWTAAWVAVIGTLSVAISSHIFSSRYEYQAQSYEVTARRLRNLQSEWGLVREADRESRAGEFVDAFESTISVENRKWVADWQGDKAIGEG
jgi:hypothetical protein